MAQRCSFLPTRHAWGGRRRRGPLRAHGAQGARRSDIRSSDGSGVGAGGAGLPMTRGHRTARRSGGSSVSGPVCVRMAARDCIADRADRRAVPIRGGGPRSGGVGPVSFGRCPTDPSSSSARPRTGSTGSSRPTRRRGCSATTRSCCSGPTPTDDDARRRPAARVRDRRPARPAGRPASRGRAALRVVMNVEGNFYPNVDYEACFRAGIHVLGCGPAYAEAVAEFALGLAIDLARGISREDRAFRAGRERYVAAGNDDAILLRRSGHRAGRLRQPRPGPARAPAPVRRHDPRLRPVAPGLDAARRRPGPGDARRGPADSRVVFVLATVTAESERLLGARELDLLPAGARLVLVEPGGRVRLRRGARAGRRGPVPGRDRRLAAGADARRTTGPGRSRAWCSRRTGRAASRRRSSRSATWSSTTSTRSAAACRRSGCSRRRASSWAGTAAGPSS